MIDKLRPITIPIIVFITSIFILYLLIPEYHPFGGLSVENNRESIQKKSIEYLTKAGVLFDKDKLNINFETNKDFVKWINSDYKLDKANSILRKSGAAYYWSVSQSANSNDGITVSSNNEENNNFNKSKFRLEILDDGNLISFEETIPDSSIKKSLNSDEAKNIATNFIKQLRDDILFVDDTLHTNNVSNVNTFYFKESESINKATQVIHNFIWETKSNTHLNYSLKAQVQGNKLANFNIQIILPDEYKKAETDVFEVASTIIFTLIIILSVIIVGFKRFRAYEVGFKHAIIFGIFVLISFLLKELLERTNTFEFSLLLGLLLGGIFMGGAAIILWTVSETIFREIWNKKFLSLDLLYHRKFVHSVIGKSIINSIAFGLGLSAVFILLLFVISNYSNVVFRGDNFISQSHILSKFPLLSIFLGVFNANGILVVAFFMFLSAAIKRYISNDIIFIIASGFTWALLVPSNVSPLTVAIPINLIIGIILSLILVKYDLLSTFLSYLLFKFFLKASEFAFFDDSSLRNGWYFILIICLILIIISIIFILRKDKFTDYDSITPKFVENITERQRLQRELDVARHVQMSFLPKENPRLNGLDIASICIPAFEVGGDYYDFIQLEKNKLGIIIGDVSGKGTQAAFYMTLTKGFLKAIAKHTDSPAEVLTKMNELFYENVERGRFISMIYAVIDLENNVIKIARAGHNPVIYHDNSGNVNLISPRGMALGLEKGDLFGKIITESNEAIESGKTFIFYTDGFTEAVNRKGDEYGMERMISIAKSCNYLSASEIQEKMIDDVNNFIGKVKQHDDMTMVILKIN
ncbi:MAG TPA: hypothetical protein DHV28_17820 [Ignavibacteriales bacterium]|nr:hypothetical protein [Ignavibacteriales bacterium]